MQITCANPMNGDENENDSQPRNELRQEPAEGQKGNHKGSYHGQREKLGTNSFYQLRFCHVYRFPESVGAQKCGSINLKWEMG